MGWQSYLVTVSSLDTCKMVLYNIPMWSYLNIQYLAAFKKCRKNKGLSERSFCAKSHLSRVTVRNIEEFDTAVSLESLLKYAQALEMDLGLFSAVTRGQSDLSTIAVCLRIEQDGFSSWKIHFMNFVDEFRRTFDTRLLVLAPPSNFSKKLTALLASIVLELCAEANIPAPDWAQQSHCLPEPWFVAESESLKASALVESKAFYKKNNIFVLENFLVRI